MIMSSQVSATALIAARQASAAAAAENKIIRI